jgi:DNA-binding CsgD family transcriptional regulator
MPLTPKQIEAVRSMGRGHGRAAAEELGISYWTLRNTFTVARIKLGARTRLEAVLAAIGRGDLTCEDVLG